MELTASGIKKIVFVSFGFLLAGSMLDGSLAARAVDAAPSQSAPTRDRASFPHDKAKHKTLECSRCHRVTTAEPDVKEFPGHASCAPCHNLALEALSKPVLFCGICHEGRPISKTQPALFRFPKPQVKTEFGTDFSHPAHLKPMPVEAFAALQSQAVQPQAPLCTGCHKREKPMRSGLPEMTIETSHRSCFKCHGEQPVKAPSMNQCAECHKIGGPHSPHLYSLVRLFKHEDHEFDIRPRKKREYPLSKRPDYLCSECHSSVMRAEALDKIKLPEERHCAECHNGRLGLPETLARDVIDSLRSR